MEPAATPRRKQLPHQSIVAYNDRNNVIYLGKRDSSTVAFLRPHRYGLELTIREPGNLHSHKRYVIPGEVPKNRAVSFIRQCVPENYWRNSDRADDAVERPWQKHKKPEDRTISIRELSHETDISKALDESGFWKARGRMDPKKKIPKSFFTTMPVSELSRGRHSSIQAWWKDCLVRKGFGRGVGLVSYTYSGLKPTDEDPFEVERKLEGRNRNGELDNTIDPTPYLAMEKNGFSIVQQLNRISGFRKMVEQRRNVAALIDLGLVPESPTSVRGFDKISLKRLLKYIEKDIHRSKALGRFTASVAPTFFKTLERHNWLQARGEYADGFVSLVAQLEKLPKSKRAAEAVNSAINAGMTRATFCKIENITINRINELASLSQLEVRLNHNHDRGYLNANYRPPTIPLDDGWKFADHETFPKLSDQYNICISNVWHYEDQICRGRAHVIYREDHKTNGGAVAFIEFNDPYNVTSPGLDVTVHFDAEHPYGGTWRVREIRGFANADVHSQYNREAEIAAKVLTKTLDRPSPSVKQLDKQQQALEHERVMQQIEKIVPGISNQEFNHERLYSTDMSIDAHRQQALKDAEPLATRPRRRR